MDDGTDESSGGDKAYGWILVIGAILVACWIFPNAGKIFLDNFFLWPLLLLGLLTRRKPK